MDYAILKLITLPASNRLAHVETDELPRLNHVPSLVVGKRLGGDDCYPILGRRDLAKIDADVLINQVRRAKGRLAHDVAEVRRAARKELLAVRQQEVEFAVLADFGSQGGELFVQGFALRLTVGKLAAKIFQQIAEGPLAVGRPDGFERAGEFRMIVFWFVSGICGQISVVPRMLIG